MLTKLTSRKALILIVILILIVLISAIVYRFINNAGDSDDNSNVTSTALVTIAPAQQAPFSPTLSAYGTISVSKMQAITSQGTSVIKAIAVLPYTQVKKGQKIMELGPTSDIEASIENARVNLKRTKALRQQYLATNSDVEAAQATLTSLQAQYGNGGKWLHAPKDGVVGALFVQPGQVVNGSTPLYNFSAQTQIGATVSIAAADQAKVKVGDVVTLTAVNDPQGTWTGKVIAIANQLNDQTGLIDVQVALNPNTTNLIINTPINAEIALAKPEPRVLVPRSAVLYQNQQAYVYIDNNGKAQFRKVSVVGTTDTQVAISSGVQPNESVITSGNYELDDNMPVTTGSGS